MGWSMEFHVSFHSVATGFNTLAIRCGHNVVTVMLHSYPLGILKTANDELKEVFPSKAFVVVHIS